MPKSNHQTVQKAVGTGFSSGLMFMLKAVFISYCLSVALLFIVSALATFNAFSDYTISVMVNLVTAFGVSLCGFMSGRHFASKGIIYGALCGIIYAFLLFILGNLATREFHIGSDSLTAFSIGIICGAVGGIVGINTRRQERK